MATKRVTLEELFAKYKSGQAKELRLILKADVQGSLEPILFEIDKLSNIQKEISVKVLHAEAGNITDTDVMLAAASDAIIIGFDVTVDPSTKRLADQEGVSVRIYNIIYRLLEDIEKALKGLLEPELVEKIIGYASILATFKVSKGDLAAGCRITGGEVRRNARVRIFREKKEIYNGEISTLKREKEDVREAREGMECGMTFKNFTDFQVGDQVECYVMETFGS